MNKAGKMKKRLPKRGIKKTAPRHPPKGRRAQGIPWESARFLRDVIETSPECIKLLAPDGTVLQMNRAGLEMIEADSPGQVIGKSVYIVVAPQYRPAYRSLVEAAARGESGTL